MRREEVCLLFPSLQHVGGVFHLCHFSAVSELHLALMLVGLCEHDGCRAPELKAAGSFLIFKCSFFLAGGNSILHVPRTLPGCEIQLQIRYLGCGLCHLWAAYSEEDLWCYCKAANRDGLSNLIFYHPEVHTWLIAFLTRVFLSLFFKSAD